MELNNFEEEEDSKEVTTSVNIDSSSVTIVQTSMLETSSQCADLFNNSPIKQSNEKNEGVNLLWAQTEQSPLFELQQIQQQDNNSNINPLNNELNLCLSRLDLSQQSLFGHPTFHNKTSSQQDLHPPNIEEFKQFIRGVVLPNLNTHGVNSPITSNEIQQTIFAQGMKQGSIGSAKDLSNNKALKDKQSLKSRQLSIHTNAFMTTDEGRHTISDMSSKRNQLNHIGEDIFSDNTREVYHMRGQSNQPIQNQTPLTQRLIMDSTSMFSNLTTSLVGANNPNLNEMIDLEEKFNDRFQHTLSQMNANKLKIQKRLVKNDQEIKLRKNLKRKIKPAIQDPAEVPMSIFFLLVQYKGELFKQFMQMSRGFRKHLLYYVFTEYMRPIAEKFNQQYKQTLGFEVISRYICLTPITFCGELGSRLDVALRISTPERSKLTNELLKLSFTYELDGNIENTYKSQYQLDFFKANHQKWLWLHKDECLFHGYTDTRSYTIPIVPVNAGQDLIELSITLFSLQGVLNIQSLQWQQYQIEELPSLTDIKDYNRLDHLTPNRDMHQQYFADLRRVCDLEDAVVEWFEFEYISANSLSSHIQRRLDTKQFEEQFKVLLVEVGGIDFSVWRVKLKAKNLSESKIGSGSMICRCFRRISQCSLCYEKEIDSDKRKDEVETINHKYYHDLKIGINIISDPDIKTINEVKRTGFLIDRGLDIELRPGDELFVYVSMGGFEK